MQAAEFARKKHDGQVRKYTGEPYYNHLEEVAELVRTFGLGEEAEVLAYLHDTVEDTNTTHSELVEKFGVQIALGVRALTNNNLDVGNRKTRKAMDRSRLAMSAAVVQSVKCCDLISNCRDIVVHDPNFGIVFLDEMDELLKVLTQAQKVVHNVAHMACQTEQLYAYLNRVKKDKQEKVDVPHTSPQTDNPVPEASGAA
jgi:hypothetical protein